MVDPERPQTTIQWGTSALHAGLLSALIQTHS